MNIRINACLFFAAVVISVTGKGQSTQTEAVYPKTVVYVAPFIPIVSVNDKTTTWNFSASSAIGFAIGINMLFSDRFGFSYDLSPVITATKGVSKVSNLIFDPGPIFRFRKGWSLITRMAFETAGRYGESTVLSKVFKPASKNSLFVSLGVPVRFGNNLPASVGATLFFGIAMK